MANIINLYSFKLLVVKYKVGKRILVFKIIRFEAKIGRRKYLAKHEACTKRPRHRHESDTLIVVRVVYD